MLRGGSFTPAISAGFSAGFYSTRVHSTFASSAQQQLPPMPCLGLKVEGCQVGAAACGPKQRERLGARALALQR